MRIELTDKEILEHFNRADAGNGIADVIKGHRAVISADRAKQAEQGQGEPVYLAKWRGVDWIECNKAEYDKYVNAGWDTRTLFNRPPTPAADAPAKIDNSQWCEELSNAMLHPESVASAPAELSDAQIVELADTYLGARFNSIGFARAVIALHAAIDDAHHKPEQQILSIKCPHCSVNIELEVKSPC